MSSIVSEDFLKNGIAGQLVNGVMLMKGYNIALTKNGKEYIQGSLQSGLSVPCKAWNNSAAFTKLKTEEYGNTVVLINGQFDDFGGVLSITLTDLQAVSGFDIMQFFPLKYNIESYMTGLVNLVKGSVSEKGMIIANQVLFENELVRESFKNEFAASSNHDNCRGGLLAHTYKTVYFASTITKFYSYLVSGEDGKFSQDKMDLLILGTLCHDIGKIREIINGVYQPVSCVTHRFLGIEMLDKNLIISSYDEKFYYDLVSILLQHHGEFGDDCRTVVSYIVHNVDLFESRMTFLNQTIENLITRTENTSIRIDSKYLAL